MSAVEPQETIKQGGKLFPFYVVSKLCQMLEYSQDMWVLEQKNVF
jgi:hypothetical protein